MRIEYYGTERITQNIAEVAPKNVALVLGTGPGTKANPSLFFTLRMDAAAELYHAKKVRALLVSGGKASPYLNETEVMERFLVERGVPLAAITRDEFGVRTLDSVVRAKTLFGLQEVIVVSQPFHVKRALFLADHFGLKATGFATATTDFSQHPGLRIREILARARATFDVFVGTKPKFGGELQEVPLMPVRSSPEPASSIKKQAP